MLTTHGLVKAHNSMFGLPNHFTTNLGFPKNPKNFDIARKFLKTTILDKGVTLATLSVDLGYHKSVLTNCLTPKNGYYPDHETLFKLCRMFGAEDMKPFMFLRYVAIEKTINYIDDNKSFIESLIKENKTLTPPNIQVKLNPIAGFENMDILKEELGISDWESVGLGNPVNLKHACRVLRTHFVKMYGTSYMNEHHPGILNSLKGDRYPGPDRCMELSAAGILSLNYWFTLREFQPFMEKALASV